jgi:acyl dehydratase
VLARRFAALGERGWAAYSVATGVLFLSAFFGIAAGPHQEGVKVGFIDATFVNLAFTGAVVLGWAWISAVAARLLGEVPDTEST